MLPLACSGAPAGCWGAKCGSEGSLVLPALAWTALPLCAAWAVLQACTRSNNSKVMACRSLHQLRQGQALCGSVCAARGIHCQ